MSREHRRALARRFVAVAGLLRADRIGEAQATAMDAQVELDWLAGGDQLVRGAQPRWQWEWTVWLAAAVGAAGFQRWMLPEYAQLTVDQPGWNARIDLSDDQLPQMIGPPDRSWSTPMSHLREQARMRGPIPNVEVSDAELDAWINDAAAECWTRDPNASTLNIVDTVLLRDIARRQEGGTGVYAAVCPECFMVEGHLVSCSRHHGQPDTPPE